MRSGPLQATLDEVAVTDRHDRQGRSRAYGFLLAPQRAHRASPRGGLAGHGGEHHGRYSGSRRARTSSTLRYARRRCFSGRLDASALFPRSRSRAPLSINPTGVSARAAEYDLDQAGHFVNQPSLTVADVACVDQLSSVAPSLAFLDRRRLVPCDAASVLPKRVPFGLAQEHPAVSVGQTIQREALVTQLDPRVDSRLEVTLTPKLIAYT